MDSVSPPNHSSTTHEHHDHSTDSGEHDHHQVDHGGMHEGHEQMFRRRFFVSTLLSIPVLLYSLTLQEWLGFTIPTFPGSEWINPVFAVIVFAYGGIPFLQMAVPELKDRVPGMMTLILMAISVAFVYSLATVVFPTQSAFFWELSLMSMASISRKQGREFRQPSVRTCSKAGIRRIKRARASASQSSGGSSKLTAGRLQLLTGVTVVHGSKFRGYNPSRLYTEIRRPEQAGFN